MLPRRRFASYLLAGLTAACGDDQDPRGAHALLNRVRSERYPETYARAPGWPERAASTGPHGVEVDVWINPALEAALSGGPRAAWPEGAIVVKDGYDSGGRLELVALMERRSDGWFWAEFFGEDPRYSGRPEVCVDCHERGADFVLAFGFPP